MEHQETIWIKKEETDVFPDEPGLEFLEDPLKPDPELKLCIGSSETNVLTSERCATHNTRWNQNNGEKCGISLEESLTLTVVPSELEISAEESTYYMTFDTDTQRAVGGGGGEEEEEEEEEEEKQLQERSRVTRLKCSRRENEFHTFTCSFCLQSFTSKYRLTMHVFIHMDGLQPPTYICKTCGEVLPSDVSLTEHMKVSEGDQSSSAANIDQFGLIDKHVNVFFEGDQELSVVKLTEQQSSDIENRAFPTTGKRSLICYVCGMSLKGRLKRHLLQHTGKWPPKCNICGRSFTRSSSLKNHALTHTGQRPHKCNVCGKAFTQLGHLKIHALTHTGQRPHTCSVCGKSFTQLGTLKGHALTHTGQRPHKCNVCEKSFTLLGHLKRHALTHTGLQPHKCNVCERSFSLLGNLKTHALTHTGQRPHKCSVCGKSFTLLSVLKTHALTHTGQRPHKCNVCGKSFTRLSCLKKHASKHTS